MSDLKRVSLSLVLMILMAATSFVVMAVPNSVAWQGVGSENTGEGAPFLVYGPKPTMSSNPEEKLDPELAQAVKKSEGPFKVQVLISDRAAANEYLAAHGLPLVKGKELPNMPTSRLYELKAVDVLGLASNPGVLKIFTYQRPQVGERAAVTNGLVEERLAEPPQVEDLDVDYLHGAIDAWMSGYTGSGVQIAVIDTGFDIAHPDLQGQQARYTFGPYAGWPIAYDDMAAWAWFNNESGGWVADTSATSPDLGGYVEFDGMMWDISALRDTLGNPVTSQSGIYHIGYHTDQNLMAIWGTMIGVLVVDASAPGVYDTVYVDVYQDFSFSDEKACTMGDEISYADIYDPAFGWSYGWNSGDGYADLSGGMVYWISDGVNVYPASDWMYGATWVPGSGEAVAFMGEFYYGESHGTMTSSAALAISNSMGGMLGGMAPDAKLICIPFTGDVVASWLFAALGADAGYATGDEANLISNSYGWSETAIEAGYGVYDQIAGMISMSYTEGLWFWSTGNGGPGYGTAHAPTDFSSVHVGAGTTMQYRAHLGFENNWSYTKWGDVIPFSNSGPARNGKLNAEIIASGAYSLEPAPLNQYDYFYTIADGSQHFQIGSGTSHATPTAAGGAALGYQAYYDAWGAWPWKQAAKAKLMAAADDMHFDPLKQGAGWLDAYEFALLMAEDEGVDTMFWMHEPAFVKAALYPGHVYGTGYEYFPNLMLPGESDTSHIATTTNYNWFDTTVNVTSKLLLRTGSTTHSFTTADTGSIYLDITGDVPADTDLLKVTMYMPMSQFDPELDYISDVQYWLELHDWVDENTNGVMDITGGDWELYRYSVDGSDCNYNQVMIKDPIDRTTDGLIVRARSIYGAAGINMTVQLDYYELQTFPWITFRMLGDTDWSAGLDMLVTSWSSANWEVNVTVPADAPIGTYAAAIYVDDGARIQNIPVVINVAADDYEFEFGGPSYFDTPYNNDITGIADRGWRFEVGDWRIYFAMPSALPPSLNANLVVTVEWTELPTDVNVHVLAPDWGLYGHLYPPFGPGWVMTPIASSDEKYMGAGTFGVGTNTGGPKEVLAAPMGEWYDWVGTGLAPFAIVTRCPVMAGNAPAETITGRTEWIIVNGYDPTDIDLFAPQPGPYPLAGEIPGWFDITVADPVEVRGGGEGPFVVDPHSGEAIWQDTLTGSFYQDLADAQYTRYLWLTNSSILTVSTWEEWGAPDIDLGVWYDANLNGIAELSEPYWTSATGGSSESVSIDDPWDGQWIVKVLGYLVTSSPGYFSMEIWTGAQGHIAVTDYDSPVGSGVHDFNVSYSVPAEEGIYIGFATFGFMGADDMFSIPFRIEVLDWGSPVIQDLSPGDGESLPTNNLVVEFYVNDSVYPVYSGPDWGSLSVLLDWTISIEDLSWWTVFDDRVRLEVMLPIREGYHELYIEIADYAGNWAWSWTSFTVNPQVDVLTAEFADPGTGASIPDGSTVSLSLVTVRGQTEPLADVEVTTAADSYSTSANATGHYEVTNVSLAEGVNAVTVTATNDAGVERAVNRLIVRDSICMLWVAPVASPTRDSVADLSGWTEVGATVTVDGVGATVNPDGTWSATASLSEGANSILVEATDGVGNTKQVWVDMELDTTPPSLVIASPADGSNTTEASVTVSGTAEAGATVTVNGVLASDGTADWSATIVLAQGMNTITVTATDALGNSMTDSIVVEFIPPVYVTPEELAAALAVLEDALSNLSDDMAALEAMLLDEIDALNASLLAEIADLQAQLDDLNDELAEAVAALEDQLGELSDDLLAEIADLQAQIDALQTSLNTLQQQFTAVGTDIDDIKDDLADLEDELSEDIGNVEQKADDTDAFAGMLMYLTLALFVIALALIGVVWFLMSRKMGGGSGGASSSMEEVESHSEVEREFEALEKEIKKEEL